MRRILTGIGAILLLGLLLAGLPVALLMVGPVGLPHIEPTVAGIWAALLRPDDGTLFLTLLKAAGWIVWVLLIVTVAIEAVAAIRKLPAPHLRGLAVPQGLAHVLVAAVAALFLNANSSLTTPLTASAEDAAPAATPITTPVQVHAAPASGGKGTAAYQRHIVKKGDTLSQLAVDHLGDADRYPEIFRASKRIRQADGRHLTDPDLIVIGWELRIPTPVKADRPGKEREPEPTKPTSATPTRPVTVPPSVPPSAAPTPGPGSTPTAPVTTVEAPAAADQAPWLLSGLAGAGAVLAGSLWLVLLRRRAIQHHHRRPGLMTAPPPPHTIPVEKTLRRHGQPVSDLLTHIDESLRRLALDLTAASQPLPVVIAVEADSAVMRLHLAEAAELPEPWQQTAEATTWSLSTGEAADDLPVLEPDGPAPWPHLATIGADDTGHWWLLNLEVAGITTISGDPDYADDLGRYLAAELATTPWSRDIQVDLIDVFDELTGLDPHRLRHHTGDGVGDAVGAAVDTIDRLNRLHQSDLPGARAQQAGDEIWTSRILVTRGSGQIEPLAKLIRDQPRRTGAAAVLIGIADRLDTPATEIVVGADGRAQVPALGLDLVANGITRDEARGCVQLLQAAEQLSGVKPPASDGDGWRRFADQTGRLRAALTEPREPDGATDPASTNLPQPDATVVAVAATTVEDLAVLAPTVPQTLRRQVADADPTLEADLADWWSDTCRRPRLAVLGNVRVRVGAGGQPAEAAKRKPYYTELVSYLATRPAGATTDQLCAAFDTTPARIHRDLGIVRKWLGADPTTGQRHLPEAARPSGASTGPAVYRLHNVLSDADLFRRLRTRGQTRGTDGIDDYLQAIKLVSGTPYMQLHVGGGIWLADDRDDQHLLVAIVDIAHLTVTMALQSRDFTTARRAADIAAAAAPDEQSPKLDLAAITIAEASGDPKADANATAAAALRQRDSDGPIELDPRTAGLIEARGWSPKARTG